MDAESGILPFQEREGVCKWLSSCPIPGGTSHATVRARTTSHPSSDGSEQDEEGGPMSLEATLTYVVALAVPVWLVVEQIVARRRSHREEVAPEPSEHRTATEPEAPKVASSVDAVSGELRRKAA
jgi:hypothetical protein